MKSIRVANAGGVQAIADLFAADWKWEGLRTVWFGKCGDTAKAQDCISRQGYFPRELDDLQHPLERAA